MKIAVSFNRQGEIGNLYEPGSIRLYQQEEQGGRPGWVLERQIPFMLASEMGLAGIKSAIHAAAAALAPCKVLISSDVRGVIYSMLQEELDFHTWKSSGSLTEQLDSVCRKEKEQEARKRYELVALAGQRIPAPMIKGLPQEGCFWIDLKEALNHESGSTSRQILIPFLQRGQFRKLEIVCDHLPKWLSWEMQQLDLSAESEVLDVSGTLQVTVYPRDTPEGRLRPAGLLGSAASLALPCPRESRQAQLLPWPDSQSNPHRSSSNDCR